ncbi:MAG: YfhO family protein [Deltaproteobacteria bacterium]|nr:YfhO family protein [Deltaproteobacteria bacterium]
MKLQPPRTTSSRRAWQERLVLVAGPAVMALALLAPGLRPGGIVFGWDTVGEHFAWESWVWDRYASGRSALWNSHVSCGFPFPAQGTTGVFYPLALPHLFLSHGQATDVVLWLHLWILAAGCAAFVRCVGGGVTGALVAAIASLVAGPIVGSVLLGGRAQTFALAWIPWMLVATERAAARRDVRWSLAGGGVVGLSLLAGQPFATAQGLAGSLGYGLLRVVDDGGGRRSRLRDATLGWLVMVVVGASVAAPQLAAWIEYRPRAGGQGQLPAILETLGSLPPRQLVTLLFPGFFGDEATTPYWGHFLLSVVNPYLGWGALVLAPAALRTRFGRVVRSLAVIAGASLLLAMGAHVPLVYELWRRIPGAAAFHFPARWLALGAIAWSIAAGLGAAHLADASTGDGAWRRAARRSGALASIAVVFALVMTLGSEQGVAPGWLRVFRAAQADPLRASATQDAAAEVWMTSAYLGSKASLMRGLVAAVAVAVAMRAIPRVTARSRAVALVALVGADAGLWAWRYGWHVGPRELELPPRVVERIAAGDPTSRYATTLAPSDTPGPRELVRHFSGLDQYAQMPMHAGMVAGLDALQWGSYGLDSINRVLNRGTIFAQGFPADRRWLDFAGVRWLIAPADVTSALDLDGLRVSPESQGFHELRRVAVGPGYTMFENPHALPRARLVDDPIVAADEARLWQHLDEPAFDPAAQVVVLARDLDPSAGTASGVESFEPRVEWRERDDGHIGLEVHTPTASLLVVAESSYPGWRVSVDGEERRVVAVDGAFLGVQVPAGDSAIVFRYRPAWLWPSLLASVVGLVLVSAAVVSGAKARVRRHQTRAVESSRLAVAESP